MRSRSWEMSKRNLLTNEEDIDHESIRQNEHRRKWRGKCTAYVLCRVMEEDVSRCDNIMKDVPSRE